MIKAIDSLLCYVADSEQTAKFYQKLGFQTEPFGEGISKATLGSFSLLFIDKSNANEPMFRKEAEAETKGSGLYIYILVDEIDTYHDSLVQQGIKPSSPPTDWPWGNREFVVRDPDGYKLVFYQQSPAPATSAPTPPSTPPTAPQG